MIDPARNLRIGADLQEPELSSIDLSGAKPGGADLSGAKNFTREQLESACGENVKGLDKLDPPPTIKPCPKLVDK